MTDDAYAQSVGESIGRAVACMRTCKSSEPKGSAPPNTQGSIVFSHLRNPAPVSPRSGLAANSKRRSAATSSAQPATNEAGTDV
jgi:hypothetical protein